MSAAKLRVGQSPDLAPATFKSYLNQHFDAASQALLSRNALIDKYIGDSIMAVFGAPAEHPDHARNACLGALSIAELGRQAAAADPDRRLGRRLQAGHEVDQTLSSGGG